MAIPRFFCALDLVPGHRVRLPEAAAHHAARVLRMSRGDRLVVFNGAGGEFPATMTDMDKHGAWVELGAHVARECESPLALALVQAVSAGEKMDFTLQKAVELGVVRIQPVLSDRSVVRLDGERARRREAHWRSVVASACEQCGRNRVPEVGDLLDLTAWLGRREPATLAILLSPGADQALRDLPRPKGETVLLAGPEGGLTAVEEAAAVSIGFIPVRLGPRVLRTETAALAAVAAMQSMWGDF